MTTVTPGSKPSYLTDIDTSMVTRELDEVRYLSVAGVDGRQHALYEFGWKGGEKVVLLPPYGMTFLLLSRLARILARRFHVLIWESHGCPDSATPLCDEDLDLASQSRHFSEVIKNEGFAEFHFVGWCQAAQMAAHATANGYVKPRTMSWIAPAGLGYSLVKSEFERCALPIYLEIERNGISHAEKLGKLLNKYRDEPATEAIAAAKLTMLHLPHSQMTYAFSRYMRAYDDNKLITKPLVASVLGSVPTLAIHCRDDTYSHFSESVQLAKCHPSIELRLLERGGHLQVFNDPATLAEHVLGFVDARMSQGPASGVTAPRA